VSLEVAGPPQVVLASTSRYRQELLARLGVPFVTAAPSVDERAYDGTFEHLTDAEFALQLAHLKATSVASHLIGATEGRKTPQPEGRKTPQPEGRKTPQPEGRKSYILAADQIAVLPGPPRVLLHKPGTSERAVAQLMSLSGRTHHLTTGVVLLDASTGTVESAVDVHRMHMRAFDEDEATEYVARCQPLDCAGSYRIEDAGLRLFERVDGGDYTGIIGLPLLAVCRLFRRVGLLA